MIESIEDFRIISSVYSTLSLTQSSEEFAITPATMSKKLKAIEQRIGKRLFNRSTRELSPTEDGDIYYKYCTDVLEKIDSFSLEQKNIEPSGIIKFTASTTFARIYLMPIMAKFVEKFPKIKINLILSDEIVDIIKEGIDLAIRIAPLKDSSLVSRRVGSGRLVVCATKEYLKTKGVPRTPSELRNHNCLVLARNNWTFKKGSREETIKVSGSLKVNYGEMLVQGVESNLGISISALWLVKDKIKKGKIVTILDDYEIAHQPEIYIVYPEKNLLANKTRLFIDFLSDELKLALK